MPPEGLLHSWMGQLKEGWTMRVVLVVRRGSPWGCSLEGFISLSLFSSALLPEAVIWAVFLHHDPLPASFLPWSRMTSD